MSRLLLTLSIVTLASQAAGGAQAPQRADAPPAAGAPSRDLLNRYCVGCHNDRLKSGNLVLANIDVADVSRHAALLEKVARKLRGGTMPP